MSGARTDFDALRLLPAGTDLTLHEGDGADARGRLVRVVDGVAVISSVGRERAVPVSLLRAFTVHEMPRDWREFDDEWSRDRPGAGLVPRDASSPLAPTPSSPQPALTAPVHAAPLTTEERAAQLASGKRWGYLAFIVSIFTGPLMPLGFVAALVAMFNDDPKVRGVGTGFVKAAGIALALVALLIGGCLLIIGGMKV